MIRFAIVGTGRISDWVLKGAAQESRFKGVAVCSRDLERAKAFIAKHPEIFDEDAKAFDSIDEMLKCQDIDAVYVGTPNMTHHATTIAALNAGKHVLCEKPMACSSKEIREMADAARKNGKLLMEAMVSTVNPNFRLAAEKIAEIGPVRHCNATFCQYSSKYDALREGVIASSFDPAKGGGALPDIGVYTSYPIVALFGKPQSVKAAHVYVDTPAGKVEVHGTATLSYPEMTASLTYSKAVDSFTPTEICGEKGTIILDQIHICRKVDFTPHGEPTSGRKAISGRQTLVEGLAKDEYYYEFKEFIDVLERGEKESKINSIQVSIDNMEVMEAISASE